MSKTVIDMAQSVGATRYTNRHYPDRPTYTFFVDQLECLVELTRADERAKLAEQPAPAQQEPVAWWDAKLGVFDEKHFDQLQPLYTSPQAQQEPVGYVEFEGDDVIWTGDPPESGTLLYATPQAQPAREWVGLTEADMKTPDMGKYVFLSEDWIEGCKTGMENAAAKLKEKNA